MNVDQAEAARIAVRLIRDDAASARCMTDPACTDMHQWIGLAGSLGLTHRHEHDEYGGVRPRARE